VEAGEKPLFWWGGVRKADIPYWPERFLEGLEEELEGLEEEEKEAVAERVLVGVLLGEIVRKLPDKDREQFRESLLQLEEEGYLEAEIALNEL